MLLKLCCYRRIPILQVQHIRESLIERIGAESVPAVLVANKNDMDKSRVSSEQGAALARKWGYPFIETSARNASNIDRVSCMLVNEINVPFSQSCNWCKLCRCLLNFYMK